MGVYGAGCITEAMWAVKQVYTSLASGDGEAGFHDVAAHTWRTQISRKVL
jgi:hypothetical protein